MGLLFKAVVSVVLTFLNLFTFPIFGFYAGSDNYEVKNADEIKLNFAAISDIHMTDEFARVQVLRCGLYDMDRAHDELDALILTGDITDHGYEEQYNNVLKAFELYTPAKRILTAVGNHDTWTDEDDAYEPAKENFIAFTKSLTGMELENCYYSTEINGYSFIFMSSESTYTDAYISDTQLEWLDSEMSKAAEKGLPIFVVSHWPLAKSHGLPNTWEWGEEDLPELKGSFGNQNDQVEAILKKYDDVFFISGHIHNGFSNDEEKNTYLSVESDGTFHSINLPSFMYMNMNSIGTFGNGCGYSIEVYENEVLVRARCFTAGVWYTDYDVTIPIGE